MIVKNPTSTQHNPKTTSTDVGFDTNMTVQTTTTGTHLWLQRGVSAVKTNPILDNHLRLSQTTILDYFRLSQTISDNYPRLSKTISGHFPKLSLVTNLDHVRQLYQTILGNYLRQLSSTTSITKQSPNNWVLTSS